MAVFSADAGLDTWGPEESSGRKTLMSVERGAWLPRAIGPTHGVRLTQIQRDLTGPAGVSG